MIKKVIKNIFLLPFRLVLNIIVTGSIIVAFILWFNFLSVSLIELLVLLIFIPNLILLPLFLKNLYVPLWDNP